MRRHPAMVGCAAGFAAAIAVAAVTGSVTFVHLLAMVLAYAAASVFVAYVVNPDRGRR